MKKITAFLLFALMILFCGGWYISYKFSLYGIHQRQKEIILHSGNIDSRVVTLSLPINFNENKNFDFRFIEEDEIMFNGKMYDVVSQYRSADSVIIKCIADITEDDIRSEAINQVNGLEGTTTQRNLSAFKFIPELFTTTPGPLKLYCILKYSSQIYLFRKIGNTITGYINVPSPPPWYYV
ncbi:MAG: hypothetical protein ABIN25_07895 [Ginsengibacter sp.]